MKKQRGITLIALIITIIILLILAGITISMLTGENGILSKSTNAATNTYHATVKEQIILGVDQYFIDTKTNKYTDDVIKYLKETENGFTTEIDSTYDRVNVEKIASTIKTGKGRTKADGDIYVIEEYTQGGTASTTKLAATDPVNVGTVKNYVLRYYETTDKFIDLLYLDGKGNITDPNSVLGKEPTDEEQTSSEYDEPDLPVALNIDCIERLIDFAIDVNNGNSFEGQQVKLTKDLDFANKSDYRDPDNYYKHMNLNGVYDGEPMSLDSQTGYENDSFTPSNSVFLELQKDQTSGFPAPGFIQIASSENTPFKGQFNGNAKTISNLYMGNFKTYNTEGGTTENRTNISMFGYNEGVIKNLNITEFAGNQLKMSSMPVSVVTQLNKGKILNVSISSDITFSYASPTKFGTLTVTNEEGGIIANCTNNGNISVTGSGAITGLVYDNSGKIDNSINKGNIIVNGTAAGLAYNNQGIITKSTNEGNIEGNANGAVGLAYNNQGTITESTNEGNVKGNGYIAGIVIENSGKVSYCNNYVSLEGNANVAGIIYHNTSSEPIEYCINGKPNEEQYVKTSAGLASGITITQVEDGDDVIIDNCKNYMKVISSEQVSGIVAITSDSTIENLKISNSENYGELSLYKTTSDYRGISGIVIGNKNGIKANTIEINNCTNRGTFTGESIKYSAGIITKISSNSVQIMNCSNNNEKIEGDNSKSTGGIVSEISANTVQITNCSNLADVDGSAGIVSYVEGKTSDCTINISNCTTVGNISSKDNSAGILGDSSSIKILTIAGCTNGKPDEQQTIENCDYISGIANTNAIANQNITITSCTNYLDFNATKLSTGILGFINKNVTIGELELRNCTNYGQVSGSGIVHAENTVTKLTMENCINGEQNTSKAITLSDFVAGVAYIYKAPVAEVTGCKNYMNVTSTDCTTSGVLLINVPNESNVTISNCENNGTLSGYFSNGLGAIFSTPNCTNAMSKLAISDSTNNGSISNGSFSAGMVGMITVGELTITNCTNTAEIYGAAGIVGQICATSSGSMISGCTNTGTIKERGSNGIGGIVGVISGNSIITIDQCNNSGVITSGSYVGGIIGLSATSNLTVTKCNNSSQITGSDYVGGILGYGQSGSIAINNCTNSAKITSSSCGGGIVGYAVAGSDISSSTNTGEIVAPYTN